MANWISIIASVDSKIYYMFGFFLVATVLIITRRETGNALKLWWFKRKAVLVELIGSDGIASEIVVRKVGTYEYVHDGGHFFINPIKARTRRGIKVFTYVLGNSVSHDFRNKPTESFRKIIEDCKKSIVIMQKQRKWEIKGFTPKKIDYDEQVNIKDLTDEFHNIMEEPYRLDAHLVQTAMTNAQLSNASIFDKLLKVLSTKNLLTVAIIVGFLAGAAALLGWLTYDKIANVELCQKVTEAVNVIKV